MVFANRQGEKRSVRKTEPAERAGRGQCAGIFFLVSLPMEASRVGAQMHSVWGPDGDCRGPRFRPGAGGTASSSGLMFRADAETPGRRWRTAVTGVLAALGVH